MTRLAAWTAAGALLLAPGVARSQDGGAGVDGGGLDGGPGADGGTSPDGGGPRSCRDVADGCREAAASWSWREGFLEEREFDTGWIPPGSPLQIRIGLFLGGETHVDMDGTLIASWPPGIQVGVEGVPDEGRLSIGYGIELLVQARFDVEVAGIRYDWEGDVPVPFIPEDLRMADETAFRPLLLPGSDVRPAEVSDSTDDVRLTGLNAIEEIIDMVGVGAGLQITVRGDLAASYETDRVVVEGADPIEIEHGQTRLPPPGEGFGSMAHLTVHPEGTLTYDGQIVVTPSFYVEVVGTRYDLDIVEVPIPIPEQTSNVVFDPVEVDVPLPDLEVDDAQLDFGAVPVGEEVSASVVLRNVGLLDLRVEAGAPPANFDVPRRELTIPPGDEGRLNVVFAPTEVGDAGAMLFVTTNDPDQPEVGFMLLGQGIPSEADAGADASEPTPGGGCGCGAPGSAGRSALALLPALLLLSLRRRRD